MAVDAKATREPSADSDGCSEKPSPAAPSSPPARLATTVRPVARCQTRTSARDPRTDVKATASPPAATLGCMGSPAPAGTCTVRPSCRSRRNRRTRPPAPSRRASEVKATKRPSGEIAGSAENPSAGAPAGPSARLASSVVPAATSRTYTAERCDDAAPTRPDARVKTTRRPSADTPGS